MNAFLNWQLHIQAVQVFTSDGLGTPSILKYVLCARNSYREGARLYPLPRASLCHSVA